MIADTDHQAVSFLRGWAPDGPWTVVTDNESRGAKGPWHAKQFTPEQISQLLAFLAAHEGKDNIYFTVNLSKPVKTSPEEKDITALCGVPLDVDLPAGTTEDVFNEKLNEIRSVSPPPTAIICSGGGLQAFWRYETPEPVTPEAIQQTQALTLTLADALQGDHVQNIIRLMRLPGTTNVLNLRKRTLGRVPTPAYLIEADWARAYSPHQPPPTIPSNNQNRRDKDTLFSDLDFAWQERITTGSTNWLKGKDRTRSAALWAVVLHLVRQEWADDDILEVITSPEYGISASVIENSNPEKYARSQIQNARVTIQQDYVRVKATNTIIANRMDNIEKAIAALNISLSYDEFAGQINYVNGEITEPSLFNDHTLNEVRYKCLTKIGFQPPKDLLYDTCQVVAHHNIVNPIKEYLSSVSHDGTPRLETWLIRHGGAKDTPYTRAVSKLIMIAAVARVFAPGEKFDEMLVLESPMQGTEKSTAIRSLCPKEDWFADGLALNASGQENLEQLAGKWIVEFQELSGMKQRDVEQIKSFLTRARDRARLAYDRIVTERPRTCVFFGTTNSTRYLRDEQNRRFWPVRIKRMNIPAILAERDQLWAEATALFRLGHPVRLEKELWEMAEWEQAERRVIDPWEDDIEAALIDEDGNPLTGRITSSDLFVILGLDRYPSLRTPDTNNRVGNVMQRLGWEHKNPKDPVTNLRKWFYVKGTQTERHERIYVYRDPVTYQITITKTPPTEIESQPSSSLNNLPL